ncbi:hypothetical protein M427DRAFT_155812 [Gonapodya prolifera JEL478]|uniref:RING-type domain-containing protein n=1 Tax=Gonapodya prolifera (strain JEL478) TaxID=1344416 RepID=A0A139ADP6_GONPJ|nr:hypothetical protein M427DRAFT_155812 [Gonapodya prolifera JEL478]|eukprot:KXS14714.1 hypothetical protein M427DRAFT_155812 [Gonapodya prolifera JEL478]
MAASSSASVLSRIRSELMCPICLDSFSDPRILPCSHTFCYCCISQLVQSSSHEPNLISVLLAGAPQTISCPICKRQSSIPYGGVSALPRNLPVRAMVDLLQTAPPLSEMAGGQGAQRVGTREAPDDDYEVASDDGTESWTDAASSPRSDTFRTNSAPPGCSPRGGTAGSMGYMPTTMLSRQEPPSLFDSVSTFVSENATQIATVAALLLTAGVASYAANASRQRDDDARKRRERARAE